MGEGGSKNSAVADGGMFLFSRNSVKDIVKWTEPCYSSRFKDTLT